MTQINLSVQFTEQAAALRKEVPNESFTYDAQIPMPNTGDILEFQDGENPQHFKIIERVFSLLAGVLSVRILLDVIG